MSRDMEVYNDLLAMYRHKVLKRYSRENIIGWFCHNAVSVENIAFNYFKIVFELGGLLSMDIIYKQDYKRLINLLNEVLIEVISSKSFSEFKD